MMKKLLMAVILIVSIFIVGIASLEINAANNEKSNKQNDKVQKKIVEEVVASSSEAGVTLYAEEREGYYYYEKFKMKINGQIQYFPDWKNVTDATYSPKLFYNDINQDGDKELIIVLTTGHGTGILEQNVHVFHKVKTNIGEIYKEIIVDNPLAVILKNVKTELTKSEAIITIGDKKTVVKIDKRGDTKNLFSDIVTGDQVGFDVMDNELTAIIGARISPTGGIGNIQITYMFKDKMYQAKRIEFISYVNQ